MTTEVVFEGWANAPKEEDGGMAMIVELDPVNGMFVRLQSWDTRGDHAALRRLVGARLRVTVEILPA